jgi:hypothetical protein
MIFKQGRISWNFILIAVASAAIVGAGVFVLMKDFKKQMLVLSNFPEMKWWQEVAESETAGWKNYENQEYGFQIKYPQDWNYGPNILRTPQKPHMVFCPPELISPEPNLGCKWDTKLTGNVIAFDTASPILLFVEDWDMLKGETKEEKKNIGWCKFEEKKTINNTEMEFIDCDGKKRVYWEDPTGAYLYKFFLTNSESSSEFYQMLSTFRFLE